MADHGGNYVRAGARPSFKHGGHTGSRSSEARLKPEVCFHACTRARRGERLKRGLLPIAWAAREADPPGFQQIHCVVATSSSLEEPSCEGETGRISFRATVPIGAGTLKLRRAPSEGETGRRLSPFHTGKMFAAEKQK